MARFSKLLITGVAAALTLTTLSGCATAEQNTAEACADYSEFTTAVQNAQKTLLGSPTVGELRESRDEIRSTYEKLSMSIGDVAADRQQALKDAVDKFNAAVNNVDEKQTPAEAVRSLSTEFGEITAAEVALTSELSCD